MNRGLDPDEVKQFYDRFGGRQDLQAFYENPAVNDLIDHADFGHAGAVFEFGFGTGRLAERLLSRHLTPRASYTGIDISTTMARLAAVRLQPWRGRAGTRVLDGTGGTDFPDGTFDRFVSTYVLDLLSAGHIRRVLEEARRILVPEGLICLASLTKGTTAWCRTVTRAWQCIYRTSPRLVGGCRPVELLDYLDSVPWRIEYRNIICTWGISSEIVVAARRP